MNLDDAVSAHQRWKIRLGMAIEGNSPDVLDAAVVEQDNQCDLGKWLHGEGRVHKGKPEFGTVVAEHAAFHQQAAGVLRMALKGDRQRAKAELDGPYYQQSQKVVMAILRLKKALA